MTGAPVVHLADVAVEYGALRALRGVELTVERGERVALVGPSGAGKSTLLGLCSGRVRASAGSVTVLDQPLARVSQDQLTAVRRRIGSVHQHLHLVGQVRVVHNVNAGRLGQWSRLRALRSLIRPVEVDAARDALTRVGIEDKLFMRTDRLSGGEQQRVALARVLVQDPPLVLADEPVSSLDQSRAEEVMSLLCGVVAGSARTLLVSLHDFDLAVRHCSRVVGLRAGRVVFDLPSAEVTHDVRTRLYETGDAGMTQPAGG